MYWMLPNHALADHAAVSLWRWSLEFQRATGNPFQAICRLLLYNQLNLRFWVSHRKRGFFVMMAEAKLAELGISLLSPAAPVANYLPFVISGSLLFVSGQLAFSPEGKIDPAHTGKLGAAVSNTSGHAAARLCAINILAQAKSALGDLDRISRCIRFGGFINAAPGFTNLAGVMNGASDLIVEVLGDKGLHARSTVGVAELPLDCAVEIEALFEIAT